jgi:uncharacterized protein YceH (UPF0502 family)
MEWDPDTHTHTSNGPRARTDSSQEVVKRLERRVADLEERVAALERRKVQDPPLARIRHASTWHRAE